MATLLRLRGYRFYFHSQATGEPPHVHVDKDRKSAKVWIESTTAVRNVGFSALELREIARIITEYRLDFLGSWNDHFDEPDERIKYVAFEGQSLLVGLMDGRRISTPLAWYPRLAGATPAQRDNWEIVGAGDALHWAEFDEDLSVSGMLGGFPAAGLPSPEADTC